jgi:hypothetical protein
VKKHPTRGTIINNGVRTQSFELATPHIKKGKKRQNAKDVKDRQQLHPNEHCLSEGKCIITKAIVA